MIFKNWKCLVTFIFIVLSTAMIPYFSNADSTELYPVIWTQDFTNKLNNQCGLILKSKKNTKKNISIILNEPAFNEKYTKSNNQEMQVNSCEDYFHAIKLGYDWDDMGYVVGSDSSCCDPLNFLNIAQKPKVSYIRNFNLTNFQSFQSLAPLIGNIKNYKIIEKNKTYLHLFNKNDQTNCDITIDGWGDINHDGYDDIIIEIYLDTSGDGVDSGFFSIVTLSKHSKNGNLININGSLIDDKNDLCSTG